MSNFKDMGKYPPAVNVARRPNGEIILTSPYPPRPAPPSIPHILQARAEAHPQRTLLAYRRGADDWVPLTYGYAWERAQCVAARLKEKHLGQDDCVMILGPRSFDHFCMSQGAQLASVPVSPVSAPYSLLSKDHVKLRHIASLLRPSVILVARLPSYEAALAHLEEDGLLDGVDILVEDAGSIAGQNRFGPATLAAFDQWMSRVPGDPQPLLDAIEHDTVARYMFTSGSTGMPKGVIYTHGMMVNSLAMHGGLNRLTGEGGLIPEGSRVLEWMPWSHTGAGVMRLNAVIAGGGSIYFDSGRPVPGEYDETVRNIREIKPTALSGAPVGYAMLADALEHDDELNRLVFTNVNSLGFGSAAMAPALFERLQNLCVKATGERIAITSSLAATEVIGATSVYWPMENTGTIGLPIPGVTVKLVPNGEKLELRIKGGTVTRGYYRDPEKTAAAFDAEGFFRMGDAVRFVDPERPEAGLAFDGRIAEEFKLVTGTWVSAGTLRTQVVTAASPWVRDAVICGLNQDYIAVMLWPNIDACSKRLGLEPDLTFAEAIDIIISSDEIARDVKAALTDHNRMNGGSSTRVERFVWLAEPPSMDGGELTEKGYINQRATLTRRRQIVDSLFEETPPPAVHML